MRSVVDRNVVMPSAIGWGEWSASRLGRFTPGREHRFLLNRSLGGPQSRFRSFGEERHLLPMTIDDAIWHRPRNIPGGTDTKHDNRNQGIGRHCWASNPLHPRYKSVKECAKLRLTPTHLCDVVLGYSESLLFYSLFRKSGRDFSLLHS
jgi:hypothetical protein